VSESPYAAQHKAAWVPEHYDQVIYQPGGYDSFIWSLERPYLIALTSRLATGPTSFKYLDFACGTGRVLHALAPYVTNATGVDTSPDMIAAAQAQAAPHTRLIVGDLLSQPDLDDDVYDLITAFRFKLNTEASLRLPVLANLTQRLRDPAARLVFNVHGNALSANGVKALYQWSRGWGLASAMTHGEIRRLVRTAGLAIESLRGFGLFPQRVYTSRLGPLVRRVDVVATHYPVLARVSTDLVFTCRLS